LRVRKQLEAQSYPRLVVEEVKDLQVRLTASKGLRLMGYTPSGDASQLLRLICHAPAHDGDERLRPKLQGGTGKLRLKGDHIGRGHAAVGLIRTQRQDVYVISDPDVGELRVVQEVDEEINRR
jgi:hypothetical protein